LPWARQPRPDGLGPGEVSQPPHILRRGLLYPPQRHRCQPLSPAPLRPVPGVRVPRPDHVGDVIVVQGPDIEPTGVILHPRELCGIPPHHTDRPRRGRTPSLSPPGSSALGRAAAAAPSHRPARPGYRLAAPAARAGWRPRPGKPVRWRASHRYAPRWWPACSGQQRTRKHHPCSHTSRAARPGSPRVHSLHTAVETMGTGPIGELP
jgi:hypothetical protein